MFHLCCKWWVTGGVSCRLDQGSIEWQHKCLAFLWFFPHQQMHMVPKFYENKSVVDSQVQKNVTIVSGPNRAALWLLKDALLGSGCLVRAMQRWRLSEQSVFDFSTITKLKTIQTCKIILKCYILKQIVSLTIFCKNTGLSLRAGSGDFPSYYYKVYPPATLL